MMKKTFIALAILTGGCTVGMDDSEFDDAKRDFDDDTQEIVENLKDAGFPSSEIGVLADGTVFVGSDAVVSLQASREMVGRSNSEGGFRQYYTNNLVDTNGVGVICVNPTASFANDSNLSDGLDAAIANYNSRNLQFTMQRGGGGCDATITANMDGSGGGLAGFPSGGQPYGSITIGQVVGTYGVPVATHVIQHELGHCVGLRHTDYFDRSISCGGFPSNEGDGGVGANHIPGTPTTNVNINTSVLNSCFNLGSTGTWTSSDQTALEFLYGTGGVGGTVYDVNLDTQTNQSGSAGAETSYGPYVASTYDAIRFQISGGTGDADLYVRFGAAPTTGAFDCRPYIAGNEELCTFDPAQSGSYYVMIRAYSAYSGLSLTVEAAGGAPPPPAEICDNGVDDDGDGDIDCADADCAADPSCQAPPAEICDNGVDDDGDGDIDCADTDCAADPSCQVGLTELFSNDFESGWGNFNDGGSDVRRSNKDSEFAHGGIYCVRIRDNSGSASATSSDPFDISAYGSLEIDFWYYARSMENGEDFFVELWDGSQWVVVGNYARGTDFDNNTMNNEVITVSSGDVNFSGSAQLRFRADASGNSDYIYIDDVTVSAQ